MIAVGVPLNISKPAETTRNPFHETPQTKKKIY